MELARGISPFHSAVTRSSRHSPGVRQERLVKLYRAVDGVAGRGGRLTVSEFP